MKNINWEDIYRTEAPRLLGICRRYVNDLHKAEDLMHDAFLTAIQRQQDYSGTGALQGWLCTITVNTALQYLRKDRHLSAQLEIDLPDESEESQVVSERSQDLLLDAGFEQSDLLAALDLLPNHHKIVFNLYVFEDYPHKKIAEALNITIGTSKSHLARARKKIQEILLKKILDMKQKKRRAAIFILPLQEDQGAYIDTLYKKNLSDQPIQPVKKIPEALSEAIRQSSPIPIKSISTSLSKTILYSSASVCVAIFIGIYVAWKPLPDIVAATPNMPNQVSEWVASPFNDESARNQQEPTNRSMPEQQKAPETTIYKPKPHITTPKPLEKEPIKPVILNKKLIVKDTLYQTVDPNEN